MLLSQLIASQQNQYAEIQAQIEALQEQQRQIQAYLQRLGSVESKMESAAQLVAEAVSAIRSTCPDELPNYQAVITNLFGSAPVAELVSASDNDQPQSTPNAPTAPSDEANSSIDTNISALDGDGDAVDVQAVVVADAPIEVTKEVTSESAPEQDFSKLTWAQLKSLAKTHGHAIKHKSRQELEGDLVFYVSQSEIDQAAKA